MGPGVARPCESTMRLLLLAALALSLPPPAGSICGYTLSLPAGGGVGGGDARGWCPPYAAAGATLQPAATCGGITVPPGALLSYGTCALPGAVCTGATALSLLDAGSGASLANVSRVALNSSVAAASAGCVLGVRCSYGEWRNDALFAAAVAVAESCYGSSAACAGVVAWRIGADPALLPALAPSAAAALAFTLSAAQAAVLTALSGAADAGATVTVWTSPGDAFAAGALGSNAGWTRRGQVASWAGGPVALSPPLSLAAGATATVLVSVSGAHTPAYALTCAHALGAPATSPLLSDAALAVTQGAALPSPFSGPGDGTACAWQDMQLSYNLPTACAAPPPPPLPDIVTSVPTTMVGSLDDLLRALANSDVTDIAVNAHIALNGTQLGIALSGSGKRTLKILGTYACVSADAATPLCSIRSDGSGRVLGFGDGVTLTLGNLLLADGVAPGGAGGANGGCVWADCADCSLTLDRMEFRNCTAPLGGGGVAVQGGGSLTVQNSAFNANVAAEGGGLLIDGGSVSLNATSFTANIATGDSRDDAIAIGGLPGPAGGGAALYNTSGSVAGCTFASNAATTTDIVLLPNPDLPEARGGGLFVSDANVRVSTSTFTANVAYYGGGLYADNSTLKLTACALVANEATLGDGGGLFAQNSVCVDLADSLLSHNAAGGRMGGGFAARNTPVDVLRSTLSGNAAPDGCGGGGALDAAATLSVRGTTSVVANNSARAGGGLCCNLCGALDVQDALVYDNVATQHAGGGVFSSASPTSLTNVSLWANAAPAGGAIAAESSPLALTDCDLHDNAALETHGGALFHDARDDGLQGLAMTRCALANNTAIAAGGAVAAFSSVAAAFDACSFEHNEASGSVPAGGAIMALDVANLTVSNSNFSHNRVVLAPALAEGSPLGYVADVAALGTGRGGGLWVGSNVPTDALVLGSLFVRNAGPSAGAMYLTGAARMTVQGSQYFHDHSVGILTAEGLLTDGVGGGLVTDMDTVFSAYDSYFFSCEAVRGGNSWHGGSSVATYERCWFEESESVQGDDTKGSTIYVGESADATVRNTVFFNNMGHGIAEGTICLGGTNASRLTIEHTLFDSNFAFLGSSLFITVPSQLVQLSMSNVTFVNNYAYVGGVMFTEGAVVAPLDACCAPLPCHVSGNYATNYGNVTATPPSTLLISMPALVRSGAPLPVSVALLDRFGVLVADWEDTVGTIQTQALLTGSPRTFYQGGAATFDGLALKGTENTTYQLEFTIAGTDLYGNDIDSKSSAQNVTVQPCEPGETFDALRMECACAQGYGLIVEDNTCRLCAADEVVPPGSASCETCPALSRRISESECRCNPGFFGTIVGATGVCTECAADSYRSDADPPEACVECPVTSHTFALGATSATDCRCAENTFNDRSGSNGTFSCAAVPEGGWAPQGDSRLFALAGYWRPSPKYTEFFSCSAGMCLREEPPEEDANGTALTEQLGYNCREGHTGHLCSVCEAGWAYQGVYCSACGAGERYDDWSTAKRGGLIFVGLFLLCLAVFLLFFLPLCPRVEDALGNLLKPAMTKVENMLSNMAVNARPKSADTRPASARPISAGLLRVGPAATAAAASAARQSKAMEEARLSVRFSQNSNLGVDAPGGRPSLARSSARPSLARRSAAFRRSSLRMGIAPADAGDGGTAGATVRVRVERPSRIRIFFDMIGEPLRIVVSFWQVVSSFSSNLYVPWPSLYYALANSLNVVSLQLLKLPGISCVQPEVSFYTVFNGITITTFLFIVFCFTTYFLGQRTEVARADPERRRRFKTQCLNIFIWGLFLVYPQVSSTTLLIFACTDLEDGTSWLMADYRIQCWTPQHRLYVGIGACWTVIYPFGIPISILFFLHRARVPELATWKRDCAWLRSIVQRALVVGVSPANLAFDPDTITTESISMEHLRMLTKLFVENELPDDEQVTQESVLSGKSKAEMSMAGSTKSGRGKSGHSLDGLPGGVDAPPLTHGSVAGSDVPATQHAPGAGQPSVETTGSTRRVLDRRSSALTQRAGTAPAAPPATRLLALLAQVRQQLARVELGAKTMKRSLSTLFYSNEREQLLKQLLLWAKHDKSTLVAEPRDTQLRWRTVYEWAALRAQGAPLGERDATERAAFFKYRFLFASYAVHAWFWESIDLFHKLFLTSLISFIAPRTSTQVIVACMFAFGMVLLTIQVKPFRERSNNQLVSLSMVNIFLFLFTGLLLQTNPDGIGQNKLLFSVIVGGLTTSIVVFTFFLFMRELWRQFLNALFDLQDDEDDEEVLNADTSEDEEDGGGGMMGTFGGAAGALGLLGGAAGGERISAGWDDEGGDAGGGLRGRASRSPSPSGGYAEEGGHGQVDVEHAPAEVPTDAASPAGPSTATPPPPGWVSRLAT